MAVGEAQQEIEPQELPQGDSKAEAKRGRGLSRGQVVYAGVAAATLVCVIAVIGVLMHWKFSDTLGVAAFCVSIAGLGFALYEVHRSRKAAGETREAVETALRKVESGRLAGMIKEMQGLTGRIEDACDQNDVKSFRIYSSHWRELAGSVIALTGQQPGADSQVMEDLENARILGRQANFAIHEEGRTLRESSKEFREAMTAAGDALPLLMEDLLTTMEGDES